MRFFLPAGSVRLERPATIHRYTFEDFLEGIARKKRAPTEGAIVPLEAVAPGDIQVLAAGDLKSVGTCTMDLDPLADFPSVESVVASCSVRTDRELPHIRELLLDPSAPIPDSATLKRLPGLESLYALPVRGKSRLDLDSLRAAQLQKLAVNRWLTLSLTPLERMTGMRKLKLNLFREPLDAVSRMSSLEYVNIIGPAKGWAKLRECVGLEEAHLIDVQITNLRRWNTWRRLRILTLSGRGVRSLFGLENCQALEELMLLNLPMGDLSPLRELAGLRKLTLRMADPQIDLASICALPALTSFAIDSSARDGAPVRLASVKPLGLATELEELTLLETIVQDGDLTPLANLPNLRKVHLDSEIGANVQALREARPDLEIRHVPPDPKWAALQEILGEVTVRKPGEGLEQWSIFQSFAPELGVATNYDAERRIRSDVKRQAPDLAKRLEWDTEGGAVGIYARQEEDIRAVAEIINRLLAIARSHGRT